MTAITFGAFVPQGWKMELATIDGAEAKWAKAVETAVLAEELGYDSVWVYDHFHNVPVPAHEAVFECWTTIAALSQATSRVRLGQGDAVFGGEVVEVCRLSHRRRRGIELE